MRVGIWGSYNHGNFGDDIMAVVFGVAVRRLGHEPVIYRLGTDVATAHDLAVTSSIEELVRSTDAVIIGGGGMLTKPNWKAALTSTYVVKGELDYLYFANQLSRSERKCLFLSIGSDGAQEPAEISWCRRRLFRLGTCVGGTVRLRSDVDLLSKMGINVSYVPDVLFGVERFFEAPRQVSGRGRVRIGVNLSARRGATAVQALQQMAEKELNAELVFFTSHSDSKKYNYEYAPNGFNAAVRVIPYTEPSILLRELAQLDVIISSKLHIGLAALALGVPFVSFGGRGKTQAQMHELDLDRFVLKVGEEQGLVSIIKELVAGLVTYEMAAVQRAQLASVRHMERLAAFLS